MLSIEQNTNQKGDVMNYFLYDLEIIKLIPSRKLPDKPDYTYCTGWDDYENMGISVLGYMIGGDIGEQGLRFRMNPESLIPMRNDEVLQQQIMNADQVIGFNSKKFDDKLMRANGFDITTTYDLLEEIRLVAFGSRYWHDTPKGYSYSLGAIASANGLEKTGTGELAPELWQRGEQRAVINHCLHNVSITYKILTMAALGKLKDPNNGNLLKIPNPLE